MLQLLLQSAAHPTGTTAHLVMLAPRVSPLELESAWVCGWFLVSVWMDGWM